MSCIAAAITVIGIVLLMLVVQRGESLGTRLSTAGSLLLCNAVFCAGIYFGIAHPEANIKFGLQRKNGRLSFGRAKQPDDAEGLRFRYYSVTMPLFALLMGVLMVTEGDTDTLEGWNWVLLILFCAVICAVIGYVEYKLRKEQ